MIKGRKVKRLLLFTPLLAAALLLGCIFPDPTTIVESSTVSVVPCPSIVIETSEPYSEANQQSAYILLLVEGTPSHSESTTQLLNAFSAALPELILPGDGVGIVLMEPTDLDSALVFNFQTTPISPFLLPTPLATPTQIQVDTQSTLPTRQPKGRVAQQAATRDAQATLQADSSLQTRAFELYTCEIATWSANYQSAVSTSDYQRDSARGDLVKTVRQAVKAIDPEQFVETTRVYEALSIASLVLQNECNKHTVCLLVILSDLSEFRLEKPPELPLSLARASVLVVFGDSSCSILYSPSCQNRIDLWTPQLTSYGVRQLEFSNNSEFVMKFKSLLGRP